MRPISDSRLRQDGRRALMIRWRGGICVRSSYNISAISFTPEEQATSIQKHIPDFKISYAPDFRQQIAAGWPEGIDDSVARKDWGWKHQFDLDAMTSDMLEHVGVAGLKFGV